MPDVSSKLKEYFQSNELPPSEVAQAPPSQNVAAEQQESSLKEFVLPEELQQVLPGMSHEEVQAVLGLPFLSDPAQRERWDYVLKRTDGPSEEMIPFGVYFEAGQVVSVAALDAELATKQDAGAEPVPSSGSSSVENADPKAQEAQLISNLLSSWVSAWANQDIGTYLSYYSPNFQHGMRSRTAWESDRQQRLTRPKKIEVSLSNVQINLLSPSSAEVKFQQEYVASNYKDTGSKTLMLTKSEGEWLILKEEFRKF